MKKIILFIFVFFAPFSGAFAYDYPNDSTFSLPLQNDIEWTDNWAPGTYPNPDGSGSTFISNWIVNTSLTNVRLPFYFGRSLNGNFAVYFPGSINLVNLNTFRAGTGTFDLDFEGHRIIKAWYQVNYDGCNTYLSNSKFVEGHQQGFPFQGYPFALISYDPSTDNIYYKNGCADDSRGKYYEQSFYSGSIGSASEIVFFDFIGASFVYDGTTLNTNPTANVFTELTPGNGIFHKETIATRNINGLGKSFGYWQSPPTTQLPYFFYTGSALNRIAGTIHNAGVRTYGYDIIPARSKTIPGVDNIHCDPNTQASYEDCRERMLGIKDWYLKEILPYLGFSTTSGSSGTTDGTLGGTDGVLNYLQNPLPVPPTCSFTDSFLGLSCVSEWIGYGFSWVKFSLFYLINTIISIFNTIFDFLNFIKDFLSSLIQLDLSSVFSPFSVNEATIVCSGLGINVTDSGSVNASGSVVGSFFDQFHIRTLLLPIQILGPLPPPDGANVCTHSGVKTMQYREHDALGNFWIMLFSVALFFMLTKYLTYVKV